MNTSVLVVSYGGQGDKLNGYFITPVLMTGACNSLPDDPS